MISVLLQTIALLSVSILVGKDLMKEESTFEKKPVLVYVSDPLCGWCFGFTPVIEQVRRDLESEISFEQYSGGLAIGDRVMPIKQGYSYIRSALPTVEQVTGAKFGNAFISNILDSAGYVYNSEPACVSVTAVKALKPDAAFDYNKRLQHAFFVEGRSLNDSSTYKEIIRSLGIDEESFMDTWISSETRKRTFHEFKKAEDAGITGFPALMLKTGHRYHKVSEGYADYATISRRIRKALAAQHSH